MLPLLPLLITLITAQPHPHVVGQYNPPMPHMQPRCSPAVSRTGNVFACLRSDGFFFVSMTRSGSTMLINSTEQLFHTPTMVYDDVAALYGHDGTNNFFTVANTVRAAAKFGTNEVDVGIAVHQPTKTALVPVRTAERGWELYFIPMYPNATVGPASTKTLLTSHSDFEIQKPIVWGDSVFVLIEQSLVKLDINGTRVTLLSQPCGFQHDPTGFRLVTVPVGDSPRSASIPMLLINGQSTLTKGHHIFCSLDPTELDELWSHEHPADIDVHDVVAGASAILVTGITAADSQVTTWKLDPASGVNLDFVNRTFEDFYAWPAFIPGSQNGCRSVFVMQMGMNVSAYCADTMKEVWSAPHRCYRQAVVDEASRLIVCVDYDRSIAALNFDGKVVWSTTNVRARHAPTVVNNTVFAIDAEGVVWMLSDSRSGDHAASQLSGGAKFAISLLIIVVIASIVGGVVFYWRRRQQQQVVSNLEDTADGYANLVK